MKIPEIKDIIIKSVKKDRYAKYLEKMPNFKSEQNEKIVTIALTLIATIILGIFAINPTLSTIVGLQKQLDDSRLYEQALEQKINNLSLLNQKYKQIQNDLPTIFAAIPQTPEIATLTAELQTIASSSSATTLISLQALDVNLSKQAPTNNNYSTYGFNITIQGNYQNLITVLDNLINFQRILTIDSISIVKSTLETQSILQLNVSGNAYFKN
jgi:Tfp pilus assembly protein PilO